MKLSILHPYSLVALAALVSFACSSDPAATTTSGASTTAPSGGSSTTGGANYCDPTPIMATTCNGVICHGSPGKPAMHNTDLFNAPAGQTVGQTLIGKPANYNLIADPTPCPTANPELLINASAPAESLILKKIMGTHTCGVRMPNKSDGTTLTQAEIDCFVDWVNGTITDAGGTVTGGATVSSTSASATVTSTSTSTTGTSTTGTSTTTGSTTSTSTSTSSSTTGGDIPPATYETVEFVLTMNQLNCTSSDCHGGVENRIDFRPQIPGMPDAPSLYERITTWNSDVCGNPVVNPGNPEQSAIIQVLTTGCGTVTPMCEIGVECIPRMPLECTEGTDCIPANYVEAIRQWIAAGAPPPL